MSSECQAFTFKPMQDVLLERGHRFAIRLNAGWVFGEVIDYENVPIYYNRIDTMAGGDGTFSINGGTAMDWQPLALADNNDPFYEWDQNYVLQSFIGIKDSPLRMWRRIPSPQPRGNLSKTKITALNASMIGFINGEMSPYDSPCELTEVMLPAKVTMDFGFYNPIGDDIKPKLFIFTRRIMPRWFHPGVPDDRAVIKALMETGRVHRWSPGIGASGMMEGMSITDDQGRVIPPISRWGYLPDYSATQPVAAPTPAVAEAATNTFEVLTPTRRVV